MAILYLEKSDLINALCGEAIPEGHSLKEIENAVDALLEAEWENGHVCGLEEGGNEGWDDGYQEGWDEGYAQGLDEGGE